VALTINKGVNQQEGGKRYKIQRPTFQSSWYGDKFKCPVQADEFQADSAASEQSIFVLKLYIKTTLLNNLK